MNQFNNITRSDLELFITGEQVKVSRIIAAAIMIGPLILLALIFFMESGMQPNSGPADISDIVQTFSYIVMAYGVIVYAFILFFPRIIQTPAAIKKQLSALTLNMNGDQKEKVMHLLNLDRKYMIIRYAMLEGVALFAMVGLFIGQQQSAYQIPSQLWFLALPTILLVLYILWDFPSKTKIADRIEKDILNK